MAAIAAITTVLILGATGARSSVNRPFRLTGSTARVPAQSRALSAALPATKRLSLTVTLQPRDPAAMAAYAASVSKPGSPDFHRYLKVAQVAQRFGATPAARTAVIASLRAHGLTVGAVARNGLSIAVSGTTRQVSRAFATSFRQYRLAAHDGVAARTAYANTTAPQLDAGLNGDVQAILGLDDVEQATADLVSEHGAASARPAVAAQPHTSGPTASSTCQSSIASDEQTNGAAPGYTYDQIASTYGFGSLYGAGDLGAGQTIALYELEPNLQSDIATFEACYGISTPVTYVPVSGGSPDGTGGNGAGEGEAALDIETVAALAPAATIEVYDAPNTGAGQYAGYSAIVNNNNAKVVSTSWGGCEEFETPSQAQAENTLFQQAAIQGQSVFAAAGDDGSEDCGDNTLATDDPASQPFVTGVGGTSLPTVGNPASQTVWNDRVNHPGSFSPGGGGGGVSTMFQMPSYQAAAPAALNTRNAASSAAPCKAPAGALCREVPDVSADADGYTGYTIYTTADPADPGKSEQGWHSDAGTSAAAPLWAAVAALTNASATCAGSPIGFANPALYIAAAVAPTTDFTDITTGNNDVTGTNGGSFAAGAGYDMASGLGSPVVGPLAGTLCSATVRLSAPAPQVYTAGAKIAPLQLTGTGGGGQVVSYSATGLPAGLSLSASGLLTGTPTKATAGAVSIPVAAVGPDGIAGYETIVITVNPAPAPPKPQVHVNLKVSLYFAWSHSHTRIRKIVVYKKPKGVTLTFECKGKKCPRIVARRYTKYDFKPGQHVYVYIHQPGKLYEEIRVEPRAGRAPLVKLLVK